MDEAVVPSQESVNKKRDPNPEAAAPNSKTTAASGICRSHLLRQTLTSLSPIISTIGIGATFGYSAVLLPQLKSTASYANLSNISENSSVSWMENGNAVRSDHYEGGIRLTTVEEESWIAASAVILMAPGCWLSGFLMEKIGRKKSQIIIGPIYLAAWLAVGFSPDFFTLVTGRILSGLCVGLQSPLGPVYVAETSEPRLRGVLLATISLAIAVGISISHVLGTWLSWRVAAHISAIFPALCFICSIFGSESPAWLVNKKRIPEAIEAWNYLRGNEAGAEFQALEKTAASRTDGDGGFGGGFYSSLKSPGFLRPLFIINVFFVTAQFSGLNAVAFYCVQIIAEVSGDSERINPHYVTLVIDAIRVVASAAACFLTRRYPRRVLAIISGAGSAISLLALSGGLVFDLGRRWLPASLLIVYTCLVSIGLVPIPWLLCGEIFPANFRGLGSGLSSGVAFVCFFIVVKTGPGMIAGLGTAGTFLFYGTVTAAGTVFLYFFLPETKDKTLREIEENFGGKSSPEIPETGNQISRF